MRIPKIRLSPIWSLYVLFHVTYSELFTSMDYMYSAVNDAKWISARLDEYILEEEYRLSELKQFADKLKVQQGELEQGGDGWTGNPIRVYKFAKLYGEEWDMYFTQYQASEQREFLDDILAQKKVYLPGQEDLSGVTAGLARLQGTYQISASEIANGSIHGIPTAELSVNDCHEIGRDMYGQKFGQLAVDWFDAALVKLRTELSAQASTVCHNQSCDPVWSEEAAQSSLSNIQKSRTCAIEQFEKMKRNFTADLGKLVKDFTAHEEPLLAESVHEEIMHMHNDGTIEYYGRELIRNVHTKRTYEALCRGDKETTLDSSLVCTYFTNKNHPLLVLQPVKMEILHWSPYILIYHDIISDKEIRTLKNMTFQHLQRAQGIPTNPKDEDDGMEMDTRISRYHYILDEEPVVKRLNQRIQAITTLVAGYPSGETLQVGNYGMGGHYEPHYDWLEAGQVDVITEHRSNRLATMLFYLSDVQAGGATVFPQINVRIAVKKGAAAFWLNLDMDLNGLVDTLHAGCPVLIGSKWIANKWIHTYNQDMKCFIGE